MKKLLKPSRNKLRYLRYACLGLYVLSLLIVVYAHGSSDSDANARFHLLLPSSYADWTWVIWTVTSIIQVFMEASAKISMTKVTLVCILINFVSGCAVLTFKHVILSIIPYSTIMYVYFLIKLVAVVFNKSLSVSERAETDPIVGLHAAAKNESASDTITKYLLYTVAMTPGVGPFLSFPLLSLLAKKRNSGKNA